MAAPLLETIRQGCARVAARARHVAIVSERIAEYASTLVDDFAYIDDDPAHQLLEDEETTALFVLALDAVNFGSGWFPDLHIADRRDPYYTVADAIRRYVVKARPTSRDLARVSRDEVTAMLGQEHNDGPAMELMGFFATALNDLGSLLAAEYDGSALTFVDAAEGSAELLAHQLLKMPMYRDIWDYAGTPVPILKRAQIVPLDLSRALAETRFGTFHDLDRLTICADNLLPHVLRTDGVLRYRADLATRIDRGDLIEPGSEAEVELRACAVHACELIVGELRGRNYEVMAADIDTVLWRRGQGEAFTATPPHRTRTVSY